MAVKVKDLAAELNLSQATVSLVLNNKPGVSDETRRRVFELAKRVGYAKAASYNSQENDTIQFIIYKRDSTSGLDTSFFSKMMEGIDSQAGISGFNVMVSYVGKHDNLQEKLEALQNNKCAGVVLLATELDQGHLAPFLKLRVPLVILDSYFENAPVDSVVINNVQGAYEATKYLADNGHKKIGYLCSRLRINNFSERHEGYMKALRKFKLEKRPELLFEVTPSIDGTYQDMTRYLREGRVLPTAIFAENDAMAAGAMRALKEFGHRVPEDISIVGFDDIPMCEVLEPPLTTIGVPKQRLGMLALERLAGELSRSYEEFIKIEVGTTLKIRSSVKKLV